MVRTCRFFGFFLGLLFLTSCAFLGASSESNAQIDRKSLGKLPLNKLAYSDNELIDNIDIVYDDSVDVRDILKSSNRKEIEKAEKEIVKAYKVKKKKKREKRKEKSKKEKRFDLSYKKKHFNFWVEYFQKKDRARFLRHIKNGERFKGIVEDVLKEKRLPKEIYYVGLIESGYNTHIKSHAGAVGPWQFIKGTALRYGLKVDSSLDERRSIYKSTLAAANYFKDLYNIFGSWELALCAYNAGEYRIIRAIRKGKTRNYKELVQRKLLPQETISYIPKVAAARYLVEEKSFGVTGHENSLFYEKVASIKFNKSFSFSQFGKKIGLNLKTMKKLNPDIKKDWIAFSGRKKKDVRIFVPENYRLMAMKKSKEKYFSQKKFVHNAKKRHKVRRGESLYRIAKKYKTSISRLKSLNNLRSGKILIGQRLRVSGSSKKTKERIHKVKRGENLTFIARRYKTSVWRIKRLNRLKSGRIFPGQKLKVKKGHRFYVVKRGDSLYRIAKKFGVSINRIVRANSFHIKKVLYPNQKIILPI